MYCIEFLGIPGSGKTTIRNWLLREGSERYTLSTASQLACLYRPFSQRSELLTCIPEVVDRVLLKAGSRYPKYRPDEYAVAQYQRDLMPYTNVVDSSIDRISTSEAQRELLQNWFDKMAARHTLASRTLPADRAVFADEGFVQRTISTFCSTDSAVELDTGAMTDYLQRIPEPDALIVVTAPLDTVENRLEQRPSGWPRRCEGLSTQERELFLQRATECVNIARQTLDEKIPSLCTIDGTDDLSSITERIEREVL